MLKNIVAAVVILFSCYVDAGGEDFFSGISIDTVDMSGQRFYEAYTSRNQDVREGAQFYLLGVMDSTEGQDWCDYKLLKSITLRARIYEGFKDLKSEDLSARASKVIKDILAKEFPCGDK